MGCCIFKSIQPTTQEMVPGVAVFAFLFMITVISVTGILYVLTYFSGV